SGGSLLARGRLGGHLDVLDRLAGGAARATDQVRAQPARALAREGRDHDLVDRVELERVLDGRERVGVADLTRGLEAGFVQTSERALEPRGRLLGSAVADRADHDEAVRRQ